MRRVHSSYSAAYKTAKQTRSYDQGQTCWFRRQSVQHVQEYTANLQNAGRPWGGYTPQTLTSTRRPVTGTAEKRGVCHADQAIYVKHSPHLLRVQYSSQILLKQVMMAHHCNFKCYGLPKGAVVIKIKLHYIFKQPEIRSRCLKISG